MSFTVKIKEEISNIKSTKSELIAEVSAYIKNNGVITANKITLDTEIKSIVDRMVDSIELITDINPKVEVIGNLNFSKNNLYQITISENINALLKDLGILDENNRRLPIVPEYIVGANEEIRAYIRGAFFASGSVSDPKVSRYHFELLTQFKEEAVFLQKLLNLFDLNAKILSREKGYMIYIKESEKISDLLKLIGANNAVMYYENVRIYRDQKNKTNRLNNMEQANTDRAYETANEQLKQIEIIEENDGINLLDDRAKIALEYRKKYPESSMKELAEIITEETGKHLSKSGINHRFRKIKDLAESFEKMKIQNKL